MSKKLPIFLFLCLCLLLPSGCATEDTYLWGTVETLYQDQEGNLTGLLLDQEYGPQVGAIFTEDLFFHIPPEYTEGILQPGTMVGMTGQLTRALFPGQPRPNKVYEVHFLRMEEFPTGETRSLVDGTKVTLYWNRYDILYRLEDGTDLLRDKEPDLALSSVNWEEIPQSEALQASVEAYWQDRGALYPIDRALETAYQVWQNTEDKTRFSSRITDQVLLLNGWNDKALFFTTRITVPTATWVGVPYYVCDVFDRETGSRIPTEDLFILPLQEVRQTIARLCCPANPTLREEMARSLDLSTLNFYVDQIDFLFSPTGQLENAETYTLSYEDMAPCLQPWAIPQQSLYTK